MLNGHAPSSANDLSTTALRRMKTRLTCSATIALLAFAFAPTAQAVYVEFGNSTSEATDQTVDIEMNGHSITIIDETRVVRVDAGEYGFRLSYDVHVKTVQFNDGPVMLSSVEFENPNRRARIDGPDGVTHVLAGATVNRYVSSVQAIGYFDAGIGDTAEASSGGVNVDLGRPVSAIPEPNAAMLFAAGMSFVAVSTRRKR
jgi:hypothetical protein